jgi:hypothetical protein
MMIMMIMIMMMMMMTIITIIIHKNNNIHDSNNALPHAAQFRLHKLFVPKYEDQLAKIHDWIERMEAKEMQLLQVLPCHVCRQPLARMMVCFCSGRGSKTSGGLYQGATTATGRWCRRALHVFSTKNTFACMAYLHVGIGC